jgi:hypothetical protein
VDHRCAHQPARSRARTSTSVRGRPLVSSGAMSERAFCSLSDGGSSLQERADNNNQRRRRETASTALSNAYPASAPPFTSASAIATSLRAAASLP